MKHLLLFVFSVLLLAIPASAVLSPIGKGIRYKKVFLFDVQVYEAELLVSNADDFKKALKDKTPIEAFRNMETVALRLKFLRTVEASKIRDSFVEALQANHVAASEPKMSEFLKKVEETPSYDTGKTATITADLKRGVLTYESPDHKISEIPAKTPEMEKIFSIWLGVPADKGLASLKDALLGKP